MKLIISIFIFFFKYLLAHQLINHDFESRWMEELFPIIKNQTILDISLPGSHDTLSSDSSTSIADHANSINKNMAWFLHIIWSFIDLFKIGNWIRAQAITQGLKIKDQLDSGIRFLDFRLAYSAAPNHFLKYEWYSLHMVQSNKKAIEYLFEVKSWLLSHNKEIIIIWFSNHGCEGCNNTYNVDSKIMQNFWMEVESLFEGKRTERNKNKT